MANYKQRVNAALNVSLRRQYNIPLDVTDIFENLADFEAYVQQNAAYAPSGYDPADIAFLKSINPYSYVGQICAVLGENNVDVFVITKVGENGTYKSVGGTTVENNLTSTSTTNALSANMGRVLNNDLTAVKNRGYIISNWDSTTGLAAKLTQGFQYRDGDQLYVTNKGTVNYKPFGTAYDPTAEKQVEANPVNVGDMYVFYNSNWKLSSGSGTSIAVDSELSDTSVNPVQNKVIKGALDNKQAALSADQLAATNSGITSTKVGTYESHLSNNDVHVTATQKNTWNSKQDSTSNSLQTTHKTIVEAINEVNAKTKSLAYTVNDYQELVTALNSAAKTALNVGYNIYVIKDSVPDVWVCKVEDSQVSYTYTTDEAMIAAMTEDVSTTLQVGYFRLAKLESEKPILNNVEYVLNKVQTVTSGSEAANQYPSISAILAYHDSTKQDVSNLVTTLDATSDNTHYPSAKAVYDNQVEYINLLSADTPILILRNPGGVVYEDQGTPSGIIPSER